MEGLEVEIARFKELAAAMPEIQKQALAEIGTRQLNWARTDYKRKARHSGEWKDDKRSTIANRMRKLGSYKGLKSKAAKAAAIDKVFGNYEIGVDTGRLVNSLNSGGEGNIFAVNGGNLMVGTNLVYAKDFDLKRPIFSDNFMTPTRIAALEAIINKYLDKAAKGKG